jgi:hypothetical protein
MTVEENGDDNHYGDIVHHHSYVQITYPRDGASLIIETISRLGFVSAIESFTTSKS